VCGINHPGHTCDEYLGLFSKSGMTQMEAIPWETLVPEKPMLEAWEVPGAASVEVDGVGS
jgi:hypothetical protein